MRKAEPSDIPEIARIFIEARTRCLPFLDVDYDQAVIEAVFARRLAKFSCYLAERDGTIAGFICFKEGEIEDLYVLPEYQGQGAGYTLLQEALARTVGDIRLWVFEQNKQARAFYERNGFFMEFGTDGSGNMEKCPDCRYALLRA